MPATDQRETIQAALRDFTGHPLAEAARAFLATLGYHPANIRLEPAGRNGGDRFPGQTRSR